MQRPSTAVGFQERELSARWHCDRPKADRWCQRACSQILSGIFIPQNAGLGQHHHPQSSHDVIGHQLERESPLDRSKKRRATPGERPRPRSLYSSEADRSAAGGTDLIGNIIERVSGKPFDVFAREALFQPLGIADWAWETYQNGKFSPAAGLRLRPRDAAKIGQLVLNRGNWSGQQIVPATWVEQSIVPRFQAIDYFGGLFFYGYHWWLGRTLSGSQEVTWIAAVGLGGQRIFIVPDLDLVVMTTAGLYASPRQGNAALDILYSFVMPSVRDRNGAR